jgi:hypothetical protein
MIETLEGIKGLNINGLSDERFTEYQEGLRGNITVDMVLRGTER